MTTLRDLLALPDLKLHPIWCPEPNRELRWVASSEQNDPGIYLEGQELLLSTTCGHPKTMADWLGYLGRLQEKQISALGFGIGIHYQSVPKDLVRAARKLNFNLIEVAAEESFVRVSQSVGRLIEASHLAEEKRLNQLQQKLIQASAQPQALLSLVQVLAKEIGCYVQLGRAEESPRFTADQSGLATDYDLTQWVTDFWQALPVRAQSYSDRRPEGFLLATACPYSRNRHWWLVVIGKETVSTWIPGALQRAALLIGASLEYAGATRQTVARLLSRAYQMVVKGEAETGKILVEMAFPQAQKLTGQFRILSLQAPPSILRRYLGQLIELDDTVFPPAIMHIEGQQMWAMVAAGAVPLALAQLNMLLHRQRRGHDQSRDGEELLRVGVSSAHPLAEMKTAQKQADLAREQADWDKPLVEWDEVLANGLRQVFDPDRLAQFSEDFLSSLKNEPKLLDLLRVFSACNGNRQQIAQQMRINRNTVRQRIERVEQLLGTSVDDPGFRATLWVVLQQAKNSLGS